MCFFSHLLAGLLFLFGAFVFLTGTVGVFRFSSPSSRIHAEAIGDSLGLLSTLLGLVVLNGFTFASLKLFAIILFFCIASSVSSHLIAKYVIETDSHLGAMEVQDENS